MSIPRSGSPSVASSPSCRRSPSDCASAGSGARSSARISRIRLKHRIRREAERRLAEMHSTPTLREIYAPRVLFAIVIILAVLGALLVRSAGRAARRPVQRAIPHRTAVRSLDALATALGRYKVHTGEYPSTGQGLVALNKDLGVPGWDGPYLVQLFTDPWGREYVYEAPSAPDALPRLFSLGPDGQPGTPDDLFPGEEYFDVGTSWTNGWRHRWERLPEIP